MYEVIYFSQSGNTKKLATTIADELNVKAQHVGTVKSLSEGTDIFLGSGLYFMRPSKLVRDFIRNNDFKGKKVALFGTSAAGKGIEVIGMEKILKREGAIITGKYYCKGKFLFIRKGCPTNKDLVDAKEFARSIRNKVFDIKVVNESQEEKHEDRILSRV